MLIKIYGESYSISSIEYNGSNSEHNHMDNQVCKLTNLTYLNLSGNKIKVICKEIGNLTKLKVLCLNSNLIEEMSREIGKLVKLRTLYIHYNKIKVI